MRTFLITGILLLTCLLALDTKFEKILLSTFRVSLTSSRQVIGISDKEIPNSFTTTVYKVLDGDTVETKEGEKLRYIGINAPEIGQPYGQEAKDFNMRLVLGKKITFVYDTQQKDAYGRVLGYVYTGSTFVNLEMIQKGWALAENIPPDIRYQQEFANAEQVAKKHCQGLWSDLCIPVTASCIKITNVHFNAAGDDNNNLNDEWVEIMNTCPYILDLSGWLLKDSSARHAYTFNAISLIQNSHIFLHSGCGINTSSDLYWQCVSGSTAIWNNKGDEAMLFDTHGKLLSVYKY